MRLFSDRGSDPRRARGLVVAAEAGAAAAVVVTGAGGPAAAGSPVGLLALALWALVPRVAGAWLERLSPGPDAPERALRRFRILALASAVVAMAGVAVTAWLPAIGASGGASRVLIILFWASGFFVFDPGCRRGFLFFGLAVLVQGIWRLQWITFPGIAAAVFCFGLAAALRRQLEGGSGCGPRRVLVQNAAVLALLLAFVVPAMFLSAGFAARTAEVLRGGAGSDGTVGEDPDPSPGPGGEAPVPGRPRRRPPSGMGDLSRGGVGLRRQDGTSDESGADSVVLRVGMGLSTPSMTRWTPEPTTLWKARAFPAFDAGRQEWVESAFDERIPLTYPGCRALVDSPASNESTFGLRVTVGAERLGVLVLPYATDEVDLSALGLPAADLHANAEGDLACRDRPLTPGDPYSIRFRPMEAGDRTLLRPPPGATAAPADRHLEVPEASALRVDLKPIADSIFGGEATLEGKVDRLQRWYAANLAHVRTVAEFVPPEDLADFLLRRRIGDCRHLATAAALLLRAGGVPTRLAAGFAGAYPDPTGGWTVSQSLAHAWIEVEVPGRGFVPLDPSVWVSSGLLPDPSSNSLSAPSAAAPGPAAPPPPSDPGPSVLLLGLAAALSMMLFVLWRSPRRRAEDPDGEEEEPALVAVPSFAVPPDLPPFLPSTPAGELVLAYDGLQRHLARSELERRDHETPSEHAARLARETGARPGEAFSVLLPLFYSGLYAHDPLTESDLASGRSAISSLRRRL